MKSRLHQMLYIERGMMRLFCVCIVLNSDSSAQLLVADEDRNTVSHTKSVEQLTVSFYIYICVFTLLFVIFIWLVYRIKLAAKIVLIVICGKIKKKNIISFV